MKTTTKLSNHSPAVTRRTWEVSDQARLGSSLANPATATPLMGPADPGTATPVMSPRRYEAPRSRPRRAVATAPR
jgi:hypothetical protein